MAEKLKIYLIEVVIKKYGPSFIKGAIGAICTYILAHAGITDAIGLSYDPSDNTITLEISKFTAWAIAGGSGLLMAILTALQHHTEAAVTGAPQSGDKRVNIELPIVGGERKTDIPEIKGE